MSIYAIGDLHLSFSTDKPMDVFGKQWNNYEEKLIEKMESYDKRRWFSNFTRRFFLGNEFRRNRKRFWIFK